MILPQIFWFPRKMFFTWEKIKCSHQKTANIFSWNQKFVELFLKIGDFAKICDHRSFYNHSQNIWSMITHDHDRQNQEKYDLWSLMIVIWSEMIGDHDPISPTLVHTLHDFQKNNLFICKVHTRDEVRISGLSKIWIYSDHLTDQKSMLQIRIPEYTILEYFRGFFRDFYVVV